jgi:hypothetical protein
VQWIAFNHTVQSTWRFAEDGRDYLSASGSLGGPNCKSKQSAESPLILPLELCLTLGLGFRWPATCREDLHCYSHAFFCKAVPPMSYLGVDVFALAAD